MWEQYGNAISFLVGLALAVGTFQLGSWQRGRREGETRREPG